MQKDYVSVYYRKHKYCGHKKAYKIDDVNLYLRVSALADKAAALLGVPKFEIYEIPQEYVGAQGSYDFVLEQPFFIKKRNFIVLPQKAFDCLNDEELSAYILSERYNSKKPQAGMALLSGALIAAMYLSVILLPRAFAFPLAIICILIAVQILSNFNKTSIYERDEKTISLLGAKNSLESALKKLFVSGENGERPIKAPHIFSRLKYMIVSSRNTNLFRKKCNRQTFIKKMIEKSIFLSDRAVKKLFVFLKMRLKRLGVSKYLGKRKKRNLRALS